MDFCDFNVVGLKCESPGCVPGLFRVLCGLEWADAVSEFVGEGWFGVLCEEFLVVDDLAELG